jgi:transposase
VDAIDHTRMTGQQPFVESPVRRKSHAGFGGRPGETDPEQSGHRAPGRPNWRHTRRGDKFVTVVIDLTPVRDRTGPSRLLAMIEGRSKLAFTVWLANRPKTWRDGLEVVAMDGFSGFKTATTEQLPAAKAVMDPFHVVRVAGDALDRCGAGSSRTCTDIAAARTTRSTGPAAPCTPAPTSSPTGSTSA